MKYVWTLLVAVIAITGCFSCADRGSDSQQKISTKTPEPSDASGQELMIALSKAKNFHHKARVLMSDGQNDEAIKSVREILSLKFPPGAPEADDVRNDARAVLAKLLVGKGQLDEAMTVVKEGIAQSQRESFFVANLYTVEGEIHEARAAVLDATDPANKPKIVEEKHAAIEAYDKSNEINTRLQQTLMGQGQQP